MSESFIPTYAVNLSGTLLNEGVEAGVGGFCRIPELTAFSR